MLRAVFYASACVAMMSCVAFAQEDLLQMTTGAQKDLDPMISPDGHMLAFSSNRTGDFNIFVYDYRKSGFFQLTESPKDDRHPNWSADSNRIVFTSRRTGNGDIFELDANTRSGNLQLTELEDLEEYPSYAPKGQGLLFARAAKRKLLRREMNIVFMSPVAGGGPGRILAEGDEPRFSPDGEKIVFVSRRTKNNDIWLMNTDGSLQTQLTTSPKEDVSPCFSPDGKHIVFASNRTGNYDIYIMDADGGNVRQVTSHPADETQPCWSREDYIYFVRKMDEKTSNIWRMRAPSMR